MEINNAAIREKSGKTGHPSNLHMWWGRSPEASSLATLAGAILDYSEETASEDMKLLANAASEDTDALETIRSRVEECGPTPTVWDPFSGFGGIPIAAGKIGMNALANDLNPVAAMLTSAAVGIPERFSSLRPVHPGTSRHTAYSSAEGLAEDIEFYGDWLRNQALMQLDGVYPQMENGETPLAWLWVRTVKCPNPACSCRIPLGSSYILSTSKASKYWAEPIVSGDNIHFVIHEGDCPPEKESNKIGGNGAKFRCPVCGEITTDEYIKKMGVAHELGTAMVAVVTGTGGAKIFHLPDKVQLDAANVKKPEEVPPGSIPHNASWFVPPGFGLTEYTDLFTNRQLLMLSTFSDLIKQVQSKATSDALAAGMSESEISLEMGGTGALAYGQAVGVYLAFVVDKMADYNSSMCSWRTTSGYIRSTFGRQTIPMIWTFAEGNPFSNMSGNFKTMLNSVVESVKRLGFGTTATVIQDNAITMDYPQNVIVCTELPYYRDVGYADLSDYFYIWLRRSLKDTYPQMFAPIVTSKEELSTASSYYGTPKEDAEQKYRTDTEIVCNKLYQCSSLDYPALLFYCFKRNDLECIQSETAGCNKSAWEFMLESLLTVGFSITAVWPMRSSPASATAELTRVLIVARKSADRKSQVTRRSFISNLKRELPRRIQILLSGHVSPEDELLSCMGQGLRIFSQYQNVLNADGTAMCVHDALQVIYQECMNDIAQRSEIALARDGATKEV